MRKMSLKVERLASKDLPWPVRNKHEIAEQNSRLKVLTTRNATWYRRSKLVKYMGMVCEQFAVIDAEMTEKITLQMFYSPDSLNVTSENEWGVFNNNIAWKYFKRKCYSASLQFYLYELYILYTIYILQSYVI